MGNWITRTKYYMEWLDLSPAPGKWKQYQATDHGWFKPARAEPPYLNLLIKNAAMLSQALRSI